MFYGEYVHTIDIKGRLTIPTKFRNLIGDDFYITRELDGGLTIYDKNKWTELENKLNSLPLTETKARDLRRFYLGSSCHSEVDKQGRVLIPLALRSHAKLTQDVVVVGVGDHIEVWDKKLWDDKYQFDDYDKLAKDMEGLGI